MSVARMLSSSFILADAPHSLFLLSPISTTERGCCVPPMKSICLISKQNVSSIWKTHNHRPHRTRELPGSPILCHGCWLQRPSPHPAPSTIPPSSIIDHPHSHTHWCHPRTPNMSDLLWIMGRRKLSILWIITSWTPTSTSWPQQYYTNDKRSSNSSTTTFFHLSPSYSSFHLQRPVPVCCLWISSTLSQVRKVPCCQTWPIQQEQNLIHTIVEDCQPLPKWLWNGSDWSAEDVDHTLLYERR